MKCSTLVLLSTLVLVGGFLALFGWMALDLWGIGERAGAVVLLALGLLGSSAGLVVTGPVEP